MRVILDTNVWLVIIPEYSRYAAVYNQLKKPDPGFKLILSNDILTEYEEQMKFRYDDIFVDGELEEIISLPNIERVDPWFKWNLITADPDDNKFVDCAIASNTDYLVTNDRHFDILKKLSFPKVRIITLQEFMKVLKNSVMTT